MSTRTTLSSKRLASSLVTVTAHVVGKLEEFPPGARRSVTVGGRAIAVFNVYGKLFALRDNCPHQGASLSAGTVTGSITSPGPGCYGYDRNRAVVTCPWHGWGFDLCSGRSEFDPQRTRVRAYDVGITSDAALLRKTADDPGPAEVLRIENEGDYVVVFT
jgi:nitrite reductase/ring-hydroxylating ferredoxin subunit